MATCNGSSAPSDPLVPAGLAQPGRTSPAFLWIKRLSDFDLAETTRRESAMTQLSDGWSREPAGGESRKGQRGPGTSTKLGIGASGCR